MVWCFPKSIFRSVFTRSFLSLPSSGRVWWTSFIPPCTPSAPTISSSSCSPVHAALAAFGHMHLNTVKQALKAGKLQLGMNFGQLRSPEIPRLLAAAGFHWAFIDTEHGGFDLETVQDICRVSALCGLSPIVRVADLQYALVARALDCGADGVIFPRVESPELLERAIAWTKFPPGGVR